MNEEQSIKRREAHKFETEPFRFVSPREPNQQALYDTLLLDQRRSRWSFFQFPIGTSPHGRTKTLLDTNLWMSGMLECPYAFYFKALSALFVKDGRGLSVGSTPWYRGTVATLSVDRKTYLVTHLDRVADRSAFFADEESLREALGRGIWNLLEPVPWVPILISEQQAFCVNVEFSDLLDWKHAPDALVLYLDGVLFRAIL